MKQTVKTFKELNTLDVLERILNNGGNPVKLYVSLTNGSKVLNKVVAAYDGYFRTKDGFTYISCYEVSGEVNPNQCPIMFTPKGNEVDPLPDNIAYVGQGKDIDPDINLNCVEYCLQSRGNWYKSNYGDFLKHGHNMETRFAVDINNPLAQTYFPEHCRIRKEYIESLKPKFEENDWLYCVKDYHDTLQFKKGDLYQFSQYETPNRIQVKADGNSMINSIGEQYFRKATPEEIEAFLRKKLGVKEGDTVNVSYKSNKVTNKNIGRIGLYSNIPWNRRSILTDDYFENYGECLVVQLQWGLYPFGLQDDVKIEKANQLPIINGYSGRIEGDFAFYGNNCAKIGLGILRSMLKNYGGNRSVASITLDSGVTITREQAEKIIEIWKNKP